MVSPDFLIAKEKHGHEYTIMIIKEYLGLPGKKIAALRGRWI